MGELKQETIDNFKEIIKEDDELLEVFKKGRKIYGKIKCLKHNIVYEMRRDNYKKGQLGCEDCRKEEREKEYNEQIKSIGWETAEKYRGDGVSIKHRCLKCGNIRKYIPNKLKHNQYKCYCCGGRRTQDENEQLIKDWCKKNNFIFIDFFRGEKSELFFHYKENDNEDVLKKSLQSVKNNRLHNIKNGTWNEKNKTEIFSYFKNNLKENEEIIDVYKKNGRWWYAKINCKYHGVFDISKASYDKGCGCQKCGVERSRLAKIKNDEEIINEISEDLTDKAYKLLKIFRKNGEIWLKLSCLKHGEFNIRKHHLQNGNGCPKCSSSKGETRIRKFLENNNIQYESEYRFKYCRGIKYPLPFDFYIPSLNIAIEYDGEQHFEPMRFSHTKEKNIEKFKATQRNDKIKNKYCKDNNIKLIRIPYTEYNNVEEILKKELSI